MESCRHCKAPGQTIGIPSSGGRNAHGRARAPLGPGPRGFCPPCPPLWTALNSPSTIGLIRGVQSKLSSWRFCQLPFQPLEEPPKFLQFPDCSFGTK
ncbi:unnamed protein product, partial [Nesidiocoris tenuis]